MSDADAKHIMPADIPVLAKAARLEFGAGRREIVAPALDGMLQLIDLLDDVDVGETPPTNSFTAAWREAE
jgi:Asp-tRNA(Asn)/Glu-tRNA(Gln) amidotransferase C subunit